MEYKARDSLPEPVFVQNELTIWWIFLDFLLYTSNGVREDFIITFIYRITKSR